MGIVIFPKLLVVYTVCSNKRGRHFSGLSDAGMLNWLMRSIGLQLALEVQVADVIFAYGRYLH